MLSHSLSLICAVADVEAADAFFAALGWGDHTFVSAASANGSEPATHMGAHSYQSAEYVATLQAAQASDDETLDILDSIIIYAVESDTPQYDAALTANGLQRVQVPFEL